MVNSPESYLYLVSIKIFIWLVAEYKNMLFYNFFVAGYGDMVPNSTLGKCMGSCAVFCGLIIIALPATIIVTRFSEEYEKSKMQNESPM